MAKSASPAKPETVTLRHIGAVLSENHELSKKQVTAMLEDMVADITKHLKKGARIRIGGLGILTHRPEPQPKRRVVKDVPDCNYQHDHRNSDDER